MAVPPFSHEKLEVYRLALKFISWVTPVLREAKQKSVSESAVARDHLDRASLSVVYNIAEGNGKYSPGSRKAFFEIALGSATECAACLDTLVAKDIFAESRIIDGKTILFRTVQMLTKLIQLQANSDMVREPETEYEVDEEN